MLGAALYRRFINNCPPEDLQGGERILFQVETAWWFYEDNYRDKDQSLPQFKLYGFADLSKYHRASQRLRPAPGSGPEPLCASQCSSTALYCDRCTRTCRGS